MMMISDGNSTLSSFVIFLNSSVSVCVWFYIVGKRTIDDLYCIIRGDFSFSFPNMWTTVMIENWHHTHTHSHTLTHASNDDVRMMVAEHANRLPIDILTLLGSRCVVDVVTLKEERKKKKKKTILRPQKWFGCSDQNTVSRCLRLFSALYFLGTLSFPFNTIIIIFFRCGSFVFSALCLLKLVKQSIRWAPSI